MMRHMRFILTFLVCTISINSAVHAQINLVRNPGFENYTLCPDEWDEAKYCTHWSGLDTSWNPPDWLHDRGGSPDYVNSCSTIPYTTVPNNYAFHQNTHSGNGMMQLQMYHTDGDTGQVRDYLQSQLSQTLSAGRSYYVRFYTVIEQTSPEAVNNMGAYFDNGSIDTTHRPNEPQTQYTPQILDTSIVNDTLNWKKIEGIFTATGSERFITMGNFFNKAHTNHIPTYSSWSGLAPYYLIDDVSVIDCSSEPFTGNDTTIHPGDSAFIGPHESLLPYRWFVLGSTTPIDSGGGIWVHPTVTTTYIVEQNLCGMIKYDTVKVWVIPVGSLQLAVSSLCVYPNPTSRFLTIENAANCEITIYSMIGVKVWSGALHTTKETIYIENLANGIYSAQIRDSSSGEKIVTKIIKE